MGVFDWIKGRFSSEEEQQEPMIACARCNFEYPESSMIIGDTAVYCPDCHEKAKKEAAEEEFRRKQAVALQRTKYYCYDCKFHFSRKKDFMLRLCPNCGSENFVEQDKLI
jgi:Zn finger protein HypA/HybF involved in hydrogenase expression